MRRSLPLLVLAGLLVSGTALGARPAITVPARAQVSGPVIRLGDVARLRGFAGDARRRFAAIELGSAPAVGLGKLIPRTYLRATLRKAGVGPGVALKLPRRLEVRRASRTLPGQEVAARVRTALRRQMPHAADDVASIKLPHLSDMRIPADAQLSVGFRDGEDFRGSVVAEVRVSEHGKLVRAQRVSARVDVFTTVYVPREAISRGRIVSAADLAPLRVPQSRAPRDAILDPSEVEGARVRRALVAGEPVQRRFLDVPPMVSRGDRVRLVATRGNVRISTVGEALGAARRGETVKVRNVASRKIVAGRVAAPQTVEVEF